MTENPPAPPRSTMAARPRRVARTIASAGVGTALEWYDFYLYATASALVFNKLFFPSFDPALGTLASFGSYAIGFFFRPLGGFIFGYIGDRYGRKPVLFCTLLLMGGGTFLMGCLPGYPTIGIWAPVLLIFLRAIQGLGAGAEFGSAIVLSAEAAAPRRRGLVASISGVGIAAGIVLSSGAFSISQAIFGEDGFVRYGWRFAFLLSIIAVGAGLWVRLRVNESAEFIRFKQAEAEKNRRRTNPIRLVWSDSRREFLIAFGCRMAENSSGFMLQTWLLAYMTDQAGVPANVGVTAVMISAGVGMLTIPTWGWLSDRMGRRPIFLAGAILFGAGTFPLFWVIGTGNPVAITVSMVVMIAGANYSMFSVESAFFAELFPTRSRVSGIALAREISAVFAGGLAPVIASALVILGGGSYILVGLYMMLMSVITVIALLSARETRATNLAHHTNDAAT